MYENRPASYRERFDSLRVLYCILQVFSESPSLNGYLPVNPLGPAELDGLPFIATCSYV